MLWFVDLLGLLLKKCILNEVWNILNEFLYRMGLFLNKRKNKSIIY